MRRSLVTVILACLPAVALGQGSSAPAKNNDVIFAGSVVDSLQRPIANAEVSLPGLSIKGVTNDKGEFRLKGIAPGIHRILIRHIGYGQLDTTIVFTPDQTVERRVTLGRIVTLDSVAVVATIRDPALAEFEENRARGFGRFFTRAELEKKTGQTLGNVMIQLQGVDVIRGNGGQHWVVSKRAPFSRCPPTSNKNSSPAEARAAQEVTDRCLRNEHMLYVPEPYEVQLSMKRACYAQVYLDRSLMNSGRPTPPFDLNTFSPERLEAIEWYADQSQTPAKYSGLEAPCGVLILHRRR